MVERYRAGVNNKLKGINYNVITFCKDSCRITEILEETKFALDLESTVYHDFDPRKTRYLYFLRDLIINEFAHL